MTNEGHKLENIIIGGSITALRHAWKTKTRIVYTEVEFPHFLEFDKETELEIRQLCFDLSMYGLIPFSDKLNSIRVIEEQNTIRLILNNSFRNLQYKHLHIFSDLNVVGLPVPTYVCKDFKVLDWIHMGQGRKHRYEQIEDKESKFVSTIKFYPSPAASSFHPDLKDAVAISHIQERDLNKIEWSDSYARLKSIKMMTEAGIKFSSSKIETTHREIIPLRKTRYPTMKNVTLYG